MMVFDKSPVVLLALAVVLMSGNVANGFGFGMSNCVRRSHSRVEMAAGEAEQKSKIVVVSPPGGVGEVAAFEAAKRGSHVRWFVVSSEASKNVVLSAPALKAVAAAGGQIELAGADASSLLLPVEDANSALAAVGQWCGAFDADGIICTLDAQEQAGTTLYSRSNSADGVDVAQQLKDAIRVAAREAAKTTKKTATRIAILSVDDAMSSDSDTEEGNAVSKAFSSLLNKDQVSVPSSLSSAMSTDANFKVTTLRHGELFGTPESSPEFSPFVKGPRKEPQIREEYTMRAVRMDPTLSVSGNTMSMGSGYSGTVSSRLSLGEAAARMAQRSIQFDDGMDVSLTSQRGTETPTTGEWEEEFARVAEMASAGPSGSSTVLLFKAAFENVPDSERLADWIATKWAPAVMRTYDIAGIRIGARPVYALRAGDGLVEIVWQQLVDFKSQTIGSMLIQVTDTAIVASRGPGDAGAGFGSVSRTPLNGEDVMVRRLADAASQAIEKGLAVKPAVKKVKEVKKAVVPAPVASTMVSSGSVETAAASETGPRVAGARRSSERARGKRKKTEGSPPEKTNDSSSEGDASKPDSWQ
mmetsp:Transcript_17933/g.32482  ORF Transcript_17933/g.32482 Transcript_17933/m.32482 type:complete len:584 (-) Transcript_17933:104-1855(-)|eukprot:CAMPEP_0198294668 /NCGR_PEP_ID=MMETSP1449-20131203/23584_1 /TAXON_ID=420275 /ORGANISM="Attheya septentrionalis, Strain CCMP2084" /LENGTH=583 /DNA_ID=CAMNT_0043994687 /DNA_START=165 /DNA_END=1916 /DNA_ORIENTATION=+